MNTAKLRYPVIGFIVILIAFLVINPFPEGDFGTATDQAIKDGCIVELGKQQREFFEIVLEKILIDDDGNIPYSINLPVETEGLKFYTFSDCLQDRILSKYLKPGNAVYNTNLDAIYIDAKLLDIDKYLVYFRDVQAFYVAMILSHELGHRQLGHGENIGFLDFDVTPKIQQMEFEADSFASAHLAQLSLEEDFVLGEYELPENFNIPLKNENDIYYSALIEYFIISVALKFIDSEGYSLFYSNETHETITQRVYKQLINERSSDWLPEASRSVLDRFYSNIREIESRIVKEVSLKNSIVAFAWKNSGLCILDDQGTLFEVSLEEVNSGATGEILELRSGPTHPELSTNRANQDIPEAFVEVDALLQPLSNDRLLLVGNGNRYLWTGNDWKNDSLSGFGYPALMEYNDLNKVMLVDKDRNYTTTFHQYDLDEFVDVYTGEGEFMTISINDIFDDDPIDRDDYTIRLVGMAQGGVFLQLISENWNEVKIIEVGYDGELLKRIEFEIPESLGLEEVSLSVQLDSGLPRVFIAGFSTLEENEKSFSRWKLYERSPDGFSLITSSVFTFSQIEDSDALPTELNLTPAGQNHLLIRFDGAYEFGRLIDLRNSKHFPAYFYGMFGISKTGYVAVASSNLERPKNIFILNANN